MGSVWLAFFSPTLHVSVSLHVCEIQELILVTGVTIYSIRKFPFLRRLLPIPHRAFFSSPEDPLRESNQTKVLCVCVCMCL